MQTSFRDILVGVTVIVGLAGVATLLILFGELSLGAPDRYPVYLQLNSASGLEVASRVSLNGVVVGSVDEITVAPDPSAGAMLALAIREPIRIPRNVQIVIERGLVGQASLLLRTSPGSDAQEFLKPGEILKGRALSMVDEIAGALDSRLEPLQRAGDSFSRLSETYIEVGRRINALLEPRSLADVQAGQAPTVSSALERLDDAIAAAQEWLGDADMRGDARAAVKKFNGVMDSAAEAVGQWTEAARTLSSRVDDVGSRASEGLTAFVSASQALEQTLADLRTITSKINNGEGTAGQFVNNPDLYRSLNDAAVRLEKALTEAQLLIEKYRREGVPIQF